MAKTKSERPRIELVVPEAVFADAARPLLANIHELERFEASRKQAQKARKHVAKALAHLDRAFELAR